MGRSIGSHQRRWMQFPRRRPIASPLEVFGRRPPVLAAPPSSGRHPKTFTKAEVVEFSGDVRFGPESRRRLVALPAAARIRWYGRSKPMVDFCPALTGCGQHRQCSDLTSRLIGVNQFTPIIRATTLVCRMRGWGNSGDGQRRIVVLSDGTGNSSAAVWRTNVWRTFEALDLSNSDQVAFYDDGVGTSTFKPLALLGGAFGFGLKRNVIDIYKFVCRNYHEDDEIFGFGFSRGAFTIRVVTGLILDQGLVQAANRSRPARKGRFPRLSQAQVPHHLVGTLPQGSQDSPSSTAAGNRQVNNIRFLGLLGHCGGLWVAG